MSLYGIHHHFLRAIKKLRLESGPHLWKALQNLRYGYDPCKANSPGGKDGIFNVNPNYTPKNEMIRKLYDRFYFKSAGREQLRRYFADIDSIQGVRVVSHHLRILGFIDNPSPGNFTLVLIDVDLNKH